MANVIQYFIYFAHITRASRIKFNKLLIFCALTRLNRLTFYVMIDIITDGLNEGASKENVEGTYTACSDLDIKPNSFITGVIEGEKYIYSWRLICEEDYIINGNGRVPMSDGEIKIEFDGNNFVVNIDCVDDADNKFAGKFEGAAIEIYDRSK